ncbi:TetR/AcrR family transcriptional regulator [Saccharothrix variisporea]|uniref:TetR family transcriptional regulator n=1 Tax=Saccharothrix variisporea TaxID=543527 RepID=A0A495XTK9_9PSEU|nr:TetR/AcrR family transcriptional regulator [Saccharothrix variisporea]RKT75018.1 TetR family transcriptional regulator [Saccharothrix variisporea]
MPDVKHFDPDAVLDTVVRLFWQRGVATTGIQDIVDATGLNRSSLYSTFGGKQDLYRAALDRYARERTQLAPLEQDDRGLPAVTDFFHRLVDVRSSGEHAGWGCLISNAHAGAENEDPEVRAVLDRQHRRLHNALRQALHTARRLGQIDTDPEAAASVLALLAHAVNLRSRAGADAEHLRATVDAAIAMIARR